VDPIADRTGRDLSPGLGAVAAPLEAQLDRLYSHRFSAAEQAAKAKVWKVLCETFFARYVPPGATVLDLGAGDCVFINQIRAARRIAIDLNPDTARRAADGVEVLTMSLERLDARIEPDSVDLAFASNVFEHLRGPDALMDALTAVRRVLRPGGRLIVMQPNVRLVGGAFWDFFDHTLPLTEKGMAEAMSVAGLEVVERRARFLPYTTKGRLPRWAWLVRLYLALGPAQWLFGKQMLVVARRPR
jgi:SAM-dependent methyltransferase